MQLANPARSIIALYRGGGRRRTLPICTVVLLTHHGPSNTMGAVREVFRDRGKGVR